MPEVTQRDIEKIRAEIYNVRDRIAMMLSRNGGYVVGQIDLEGWLQLDERAAPDTPATDKGRLYAKSGGKIYWRDDGGTEHDLTGAGAGVTATINFIIDGGGAEITTGIKGDVVVDFACTIVGATLLADQSGSIVVDIWKDTYANFPPLDADSITAAAPPTLSSATKSQDTTLTDWTTAITAGDVLRFNVDSVTTVTRITVVLEVERT